MLTTTFTYDARGLRIRVTYADNTYNSYTYDLARRLTNDLASASGVSSTYTYNNRHRLTNLTRTIDAQAYALGFGYDPAGNVTSITYPGGAAVTQAYDELNRLMTINGYANLSYDAAGKLIQMQYNNGVTTNYTYNNRGLLSRILSPVLDLNYTYDLAGNITGINNEIYTYDGLNRLLTVNKPAHNYQASYQYDAVGNRTQQVEDGVTTSYTYNSTNELTQSTGTTYTWDTRGNLTGKVQGGETWVYTFDLANRLTEVKKNNATIGTYSYDANGIRAKKVEGGATTHYLALGHQVMYEKTGTETTRHIFAGSQRIAEVKSGVVSFFHNDHLGSPRRVTDANGVLGLPIANKPFGEPHAGSTPTSYGFTGKDLDDTGLYYFAARYYDPAVGRFGTEDTWIGRHHQPVSQNRYVYVLNNPLRYVDPTGHWDFDLICSGGGAAGLTATVSQVDQGVALKQLAQGLYFAGIHIVSGITQGMVDVAAAIVDAFSGESNNARRARSGSGGNSASPDPGDDKSLFKRLGDHFRKHVEMQDEFGRMSAEQYYDRALDLATSTADGVNIIARALSEGRLAVYNALTNELVIVHNGQYIGTFFKPTMGYQYFMNMR